MTAAPCLACSHPKRRKIDETILRGEALPAVATRYAIPYQTLWRHKSKHISPRLKKAMEAEENAAFADVIGSIRWMDSLLKVMLVSAFRSGKPGVAAMLVREIRANQRTIAELRGGPAAEAGVKVSILQVTYAEALPPWATAKVTEAEVVAPLPELPASGSNGKNGGGE
jgi:hypothetical protein